MYGWCDLKPLFLRRLRPELLTSIQMVSQKCISFAWRHKQPTYFFRSQWAGPIFPPDRPFGPMKNRWAACASRQSFLTTGRPSDATATLSVNMLTLTVATAMLSVNMLTLNGCNVLILVNRSSPSMPGKIIYTCKPYWFAWVVTFMKHILSAMTS